MILFSIWNIAVHKYTGRDAKGEMFLCGENLHVLGPPPTPSCVLSRDSAEGSPGPSESSYCEFLWVEVLSGCFISLSIKRNCRYVLCPDNHLVEAQKKLQNRNEVISLKWLVGPSKVSGEELYCSAPRDLSRVAGVPGRLPCLLPHTLGNHKKPFCPPQPVS